MTLTETCACGASLTVADQWAAHVADAQKRFQSQHDGHTAARFTPRYAGNRRVAR